MKSVVGQVYDWHKVWNGGCPQNDPLRIHLDCTCQQKPKKERKPDIINRRAVRDKLLKMVNSFQSVRTFTCVKPSTLDEISAHLEAHLKQRAQNAPRTGRTL